MTRGDMLGEHLFKHRKAINQRHLVCTHGSMFRDNVLLVGEQWANHVNTMTKNRKWMQIGGSMRANKNYRGLRMNHNVVRIYTHSVLGNFLKD